MPCGKARAVFESDLEGKNARNVSAPEFADLCAKADKVITF
jgi:hypothetical protein